MTDHHHAVVWVDHGEARVVRFDGAEASEADLHSHTSLQRLHHSRSGWEAGGNPPDDAEFFQRIVGALENAEVTVIAGPGDAKVALKAFLDRRHPEVASRIFTVDSVDHPATAALLAMGRESFQSPPRPQPSA